MAIRYSGDAEVRVRWDPARQRYEGAVRDPYVRWRGYAPRPTALRGKRIGHTSDARARMSESYDLMAALFLKQAASWSKSQRRHELMIEEKHGRIVVRRIFQAPCPTGRATRRRGSLS